LTGVIKNNNDILLYTPETPEAVYYLTRYMQDDELIFINSVREQKGYAKIKRYGMTQDG